MSQTTPSNFRHSRMWLMKQKFFDCVGKNDRNISVNIVAMYNVDDDEEEEG